MSIILVRIDDRLIHGQIVEGWLKTIRVNHIVVVSDQVAQDKMQQVLLGMAAPGNIKVTSLSIEDAAKRIKADSFGEDRVLILLSSASDLLRLVKSGIKFDSVNVGGMHYTKGKKQLLRNLSVDEKDYQALMEIAADGIALEGRVLPTDERIDIVEVLTKAKKEGLIG
jgi:mannose/fructose/sorbose-specific phosphotransferase system IIB component